MILDLLAAEEEQRSLTVADLAERCGRSPRQIRTAVTALEHRGLVVLTRGHLGWRGAGEYGPLASRNSWRAGSHPELPTALAVKEGDPWPRSRWSVAIRDVEFVRVGMPTYGLHVWLTEAHERREACYAESVARARAMLG
jgi:hypothetical protein